jgi:hypothetical protein
MNERLVILDKNRKAILTLPDAALKLWMCYWMNEDDMQESYLSIDEIEQQMDLTMRRRSIITWTDWLVSHGWLIEVPGKTAADKWIARGKPATRGAHQIKVYRVDDPTSAKVAPVKNPSNEENFTSANSAPVQVAHKVSGSGFGSGSSSDSTTATRSYSETGSSSSSCAFGAADAPPNEEAKSEPKSSNRKPKPPAGFDSWSLDKRLAWSESHKANGTGYAAAAAQPSLSTKQGQSPDRCRNGCPAQIMLHEDTDLCVMCYETEMNPARVS